MIAFQLTLFLRSVVLNLFGHIVIVKTQLLKLLFFSAISSGGSTFGDNYGYLSCKYNIGSHIWILSLNEVIKCISLYISTHEFVTLILLIVHVLSSLIRVYRDIIIIKRHTCFLMLKLSC